jgi:hypothetical protein
MIAQAIGYAADIFNSFSGTIASYFPPKSGRWAPLSRCDLLWPDLFFTGRAALRFRECKKLIGIPVARPGDPHYNPDQFCAKQIMGIPKQPFLRS